MNDELCCQFFLQPQQTRHRRYEALRAFFLESRPQAEIASRFGYRVSALKSMICRFRTSCANGGPAPFFFRTDGDALAVGDALKLLMGPSDPRSRTPGS